MSKRITLQEGFYVRGREIVNCHFTITSTVDMWGDKSADFLVMVGDSVNIVSGRKDELFKHYPDAVKLARKREAEHVEFCRRQMEYYRKQLPAGGQK